MNVLDLYIPIFTPVDFCDKGAYDLCPYKNRDDEFCRICIKDEIKRLRKELKKLDVEKKDER